MIRKLLATTAITALLTGTAMAQSASVDNQTDMPVFNTETQMEKTVGSNGYFEANTDQILASTLLGKAIYTGNGDEAEAIGDVNDVVMSPDGKARAVVVGVGGFLGMGEKEVAIDFARLNWVERDDERRLTMGTTAEELESAPAFDRAAINGKRDRSAAMENMEADTRDETAAVKTGAEDEMAAVNSTDNAMQTGADKPADMRQESTVVDRTTLSAEALIGTRVYGPNNNDFGEIGDVILSTDDKIEAYIIDVGGFLGLGEKPVALDATQLDVMQTADGDMEIHTEFTEEQLEAQPAYSEMAYKENRDEIVIR